MGWPKIFGMYVKFTRTNWHTTLEKCSFILRRPHNVCWNFAWSLEHTDCLCVSNLKGVCGLLRVCTILAETVPSENLIKIKLLPSTSTEPMGYAIPHGILTTKFEKSSLNGYTVQLGWIGDPWKLVKPCHKYWQQNPQSQRPQTTHTSVSNSNSINPVSFWEHMKNSGMLRLFRKDYASNVGESKYLTIMP